MLYDNSGIIAELEGGGMASADRMRRVGTGVALVVLLALAGCGRAEEAEGLGVADSSTTTASTTTTSTTTSTSTTTTTTTTEAPAERWTDEALRMRLPPASALDPEFLSQDMGDRAKSISEVEICGKSVTLPETAPEYAARASIAHGDRQRTRVDVRYEEVGPEAAAVLDVVRGLYEACTEGFFVSSAAGREVLIEVMAVQPIDGMPGAFVALLSGDKGDGTFVTVIQGAAVVDDVLIGVTVDDLVEHRTDLADAAFVAARELLRS